MLKRNLDTISSQCFLKSLKRKKEKKSEKNFKKKEKKRKKKRKVKERDYFSNCFTCYLLCCSVSQFISYLLPPSGLYFLWWILQKQLLKFFLNQHRKKINTSFLVEVCCQKMSIYIHVTELLSALNTICFYSHVCYHSYKMEEFPITCSSTVHSWLKVSGLVSSQSRPLIICSNTVYKMEYMFRKSS